MTNLNIAIFGCSGAIGEALCIEYTKKQNIDNIIAYSRSGENFENDLIKSIKVDYCNEERQRYLNFLLLSFSKGAL